MPNITSRVVGRTPLLKPGDTWEQASSEDENGFAILLPHVILKCHDLCSSPCLPLREPYPLTTADSYTVAGCRVERPPFFICFNPREEDHSRWPAFSSAPSCSSPTERLYKVVKKSGMNPSFDFELLSFDIVEPQEFIVGGDVTLSVELWDDSAWADDLLASVELSALR